MPSVLGESLVLTPPVIAIAAVTLPKVGVLAALRRDAEANVALIRSATNERNLVVFKEMEILRHARLFYHAFTRKDFYFSM